MDSALLNDLTTFANQTWKVTLAMASAGTVAMASVEVIKALTPVREAYQRWWFARWIAARSPDARTETTVEDALPRDNAAESNRQLVELATGGNRSALYSMAPEDMIPQMSLGAQIALDDPKRYRSLLTVLASGLAESDLEIVRAGLPCEGATATYLASRERAARRIQRNLDGARLSLGFNWKWWMQLASIGLTVVILEIAVSLGQACDWQRALLVLPIAIVGGYFAPITRDLLAALQQLRDP